MLDLFYMQFNNKVAIISGGGTGIGRAIAAKLAGEGCQLALLGRRRDKLQQVKKELESLKVRIETFSGDVTQEKEIKEVFSGIGQIFGKIDFLVNNAGVNTYTGFELITADQIRREIEVKSLGIIFCTREAVKLMTGGGAVVNIASINARSGEGSSPAYCAANAVAVSYTKNLARKLAPQKIRVNAVAPGFTFPTGFTENYDPAQLEALAKANPLGRLCTPEDVASGVAFLLSDETSYITGHTLDINGGYFMN